MGHDYIKRSAPEADTSDTEASTNSSYLTLPGVSCGYRTSRAHVPNTCACDLHVWCTCSPHGALFIWVHATSFAAFEGIGEWLEVRQTADYPAKGEGISRVWMFLVIVLFPQFHPFPWIPSECRLNAPQTSFRQKEISDAFNLWKESLWLVLAIMWRNWSLLPTFSREIYKWGSENW